MKTCFLIAVGLSILGASGPLARATTNILNLYFTLAGKAPGGGLPWLTRTLQDGFQPNSVRLTFDAINLVGNEFVSAWYFNLNPDLNPTTLSFSLVSNPTALTVSSIGAGSNTFKAGSGGYYDLLVDFPTPPGAFSAKFTAGEKVIIDVTRSGGLSVGDFL